jgi:hypothetical protein
MSRVSAAPCVPHKRIHATHLYAAAPQLAHERDARSALLPLRHLAHLRVRSQRPTRCASPRQVPCTPLRGSAPTHPDCAPATRRSDRSPFFRPRHDFAVPRLRVRILLWPSHARALRAPSKHHRHTQLPRELDSASVQLLCMPAPSLALAASSGHARPHPPGARPRSPRAPAAPRPPRPLIPAALHRPAAQ